MVDLADRAEREATLARRLGKANAEARRRLLAAIEDGRIDEAEWGQIAQAYQSALQTEIENTVLTAGLAAAETAGVGIDSALLHERAILWSREYTYSLVSKLDTNSRALLQESVSDYFANRMTLADLETRLAVAFGPVRAEMIAISEVTRASAQGEIEFSRQLQEMGLKPVLVWASSRDDAVCPICGPLDGVAQGEGWSNPPPAHPRCRCNLRTELREA